MQKLGMIAKNDRTYLQARSSSD